MNDREKNIIYQLRERGVNIDIVENQYNRFDGYNNKAIFEIKERFKCYDTLLIEFDKFAYNLLYAKQFGRQFVYIVKMENIIYFYNITELDKRGYNFKWKWLDMPKTTEFNKNEYQSITKTKKYVGFVNRWDDFKRYSVLSKDVEEWK